MKPGPFLRRWHATLHRRDSAVAVTCAASGRTLTFRDIDDAARAMKDRLPCLRLAGRIVLLHRPNSPGWIVDFLALHLAGATIVPVDAETPAAAVANLATAFGAAGLVDESGYRPSDAAHGAKTPGLLLGKLTSGTTGAPALHRFTEAQMLADADAIRAGMGLLDTDINHAGLPFSHSYALGNLILPLFAHGLPLIIASSHFPGVIAAEIQSHRATVLPTVPAIITALHRANIAGDALRSLRLVISAGARLDPADARAFLDKFGLRIHNFYGSSETGGIAYDTTGKASLSGDTVGSPLPGVTVLRTRGGRLLVSGPAVRTLGNRRRHAGLGEHLMGDLGRLTPDGAVALEGRATGLIKIGGRRINPVAIERSLRELPGVRDALVCAIDGPAGEPRLAAIVAGTCNDTRLIKEHLRRTLPAWSVPSRLVTCPEFPMTARGKTNRAALLRLLDAC